jgi:hypothetical protein
MLDGIIAVGAFVNGGNILIRIAPLRRWLQLSLLATAAGLLTACGGGPPPVAGATQASADHPSQAVFDPGSATLPGHSGDNFGNFNAALWDEHELYECNCSRHPKPSHRYAPWGATG